MLNAQTLKDPVGREGANGETGSILENGAGAWRGLFEVALTDRGDAAPEFQLESRSTGRFVVTRGTGPETILMRTWGTMRLCHHDAYALIAATYKHPPNPGEAELTRGNLSIIDLSRETRIELGRGIGHRDLAIAAIWFPKSFVDRELGGKASPAQMVVSGATPTGQIVGEALHRFSSLFPNMDSPEIDLIAEWVVSLTLKACQPNDRQIQIGTQLETIEAIRRYIDRNLSSPRLAPNMIASNFGLSRSTLYRLFEPLGGISGYIRARRMQRVFTEITSPARSNRRIGPAAFAVGFKNFSAFSRAFHEYYGVTPAEARKNAIAGTAPKVSGENVRNLSALCRWIRELRP